MEQRKKRKKYWHSDNFINILTINSMKQKELEVDFIGGGGPLTEEDKTAISEFLKAQKLLRTKNASRSLRAIATKKKKKSELA